MNKTLSKNTIDVIVCHILSDHIAFLRIQQHINNLLNSFNPSEKSGWDDNFHGSLSALKLITDPESTLYDDLDSYFWTMVEVEENKSVDTMVLAKQIYSNWKLMIKDHKN